MQRRAVLCTFLVLLLAAGASHAAAPAVKERWNVGMSSRWDYATFDTVRGRLYLARGERVQVLDGRTGTTIGTIAHTEGVHGVALAQDLKLGFTSNGRTNSVTVFDLDTLAIKGETPVSGVNPDAILYDQPSHKLYTFNGKSANVSVLAVASMQPLATIAVGGRPEFAATDGAGHIFLNLEDKAELIEINIATDTVIGRWPLAGCEEPSGLALDAAHGRAFSVCQNGKMVVTDTRTGRQVASVPIGAHPDAAAFDPATSTVYSSNGGAGGSLSIIRQVDADHYASMATVATAEGARTMAYDPATRRVFLPTVADKTFTVLVVGP